MDINNSQMVLKLCFVQPNVCNDKNKEFAGTEKIIIS